MRVGEYANKSEEADEGKGDGERETPKKLNTPVRVVCVWAHDAGKQPPNERYPDQKVSRRHLFLFEMDEENGFQERFQIQASLPVRYGAGTKYGTLLWALGLDKEGKNYREDAELPDAAVGLCCQGIVDLKDGKYPTLDTDEGKKIAVTPLMDEMPTISPKKAFTPDSVPPVFEKLVGILRDKALPEGTQEAKEHNAPPPAGSDDVEPGDESVPF